MWRALFLAFGVFAIVVGLETMVVDRVELTNARRIPKFVSATARNLVNRSSPPGVQGQPSAPGSPSPYQMPTFNRSLAPPANGPMRYFGSQSATFNRIPDPQPDNRPGLGFAGFQKSGNRLAAPPVAAVPSNKSSVRRPRTIQIKDWMPWSLLAAGAIIVLYTHSLERNEE